MQQDVNGLLQAIYDEYQKPLRVLALHFGVPAKDVEDVVQETLISFYEHYPLDSSDQYKKSMLATIARNKSIDYFRKYHKEKLILDSDDFYESEDLFSHQGQDLADQLFNSEMYRDVRKAIAELSDDLRAAARLHLIDEISQKETAEILGITYVACRARISRARKILREKLGPKYGV